MCSGPRRRDPWNPRAVQHLAKQHCWHAPPAALRLQDPVTLEEVYGWVDCMTPGVKADLTGAAGTARFCLVLLCRCPVLLAGCGQGRNLDGAVSPPACPLEGSACCHTKCHPPMNLLPCRPCAAVKLSAEDKAGSNVIIPGQGGLNPAMPAAAPARAAGDGAAQHLAGIR